jgi:hypothetical protein
VRYITEDGYKYTTDELGRIVDVEAGELILQKGKRNKGMQVAAGREDRSDITYFSPYILFVNIFYIGL